MTKFILLISGILLMYLSISGKLVNLINIKEPLTEIYVFILGLLMFVLSIIYIFNKK